MYPPGDYVALRTIMSNNVRAYNVGDEMYASAVDALGLVVGEDVQAIRPQGERPAGNAKRAAWARYALLQGASADEVADMGRDELRAKYGETPQEAATTESDAVTVVDEPAQDGEAPGDAVADES